MHLATLAGLGPLTERVRDARSQAADRLAPGDPDLAALAALLAALDARLAICANDPLSLPARLPRDLVDGLDSGLDVTEARLVEPTAVRDGWADRRDELAGRFAAYRAKALRLGVSDDPDVVALAAQIRALLATPRTDLAALAPTLVAYQQRVNRVGRRQA